MTRFYDRAGLPIDLIEWNALLSIPTYRKVAVTALAHGITVSTVWLGLDFSLPGLDHPPLIYETLAYNADRILEQRRYSTEDEALDGHADVVARLSSP